MGAKVHNMFSMSVVTGAMAAGAGADSEIFQFRWATALPVACYVTEVRVTGMRATTAFVAASGAIDLKMTMARAWTAAGTGGTALTFAASQNQLRTSAQAGYATARIATTAALGAGTKTLDTLDAALITTHSSGGVGSATPIIGSIYIPEPVMFLARGAKDSVMLQHALLLGNQEGFVIRATVPATGVWNLGVAVRWIEVGAAA